MKPIKLTGLLVQRGYDSKLGDLLGTFILKRAPVNPDFTYIYFFVIRREQGNKSLIISFALLLPVITH